MLNICGQDFERISGPGEPVYKNTLIIYLELMHGDADMYTQEEAQYQSFQFDINTATKLYLVCEALLNGVKPPNWDQDFSKDEEVGMWAELLKAVYGDKVEAGKLPFLEKVLDQPGTDRVWMDAAVKYPNDPWMREAYLWVGHALFEPLGYDQTAIEAGVNYLPTVESLYLVLCDEDGKQCYVKPTLD